MSTEDPFTIAARKITARVFAAKTAAPTARTINLVDLFMERERRAGSAFVLDNRGEWERNDRRLRRIAGLLGFDGGAWHNDCLRFCVSFTASQQGTA
jgi:hypothetical protein